MNSLENMPSPTYRSRPSLMPSASLASAASLAKETSGGVFSQIASWSATTWIIIFLILALLGINVFTMFAKGSETLANIIDRVALLFKPLWDLVKKLLKFLGFSTLETVKQTANISATGVSTIAGKTAQTTTQVADTLEQQKVAEHEADVASSTSVVPATTGGATVQGKMQQTGSQIDYGQNQTTGMADARQNTLERALNDAEQHMNAHNNLIQDSGIEPNSAYSSIQPSTGESGYCYIGEERGYRTCAPVGVNDVCMSGDVFPTNDVCINPNLRVG